MALKDRIITIQDLLDIKMINCDDDIPYLPEGWSGTVSECIAADAPTFTKIWVCIGLFDLREAYKCAAHSLEQMMIISGTTSDPLLIQSLAAIQSYIATGASDGMSAVFPLLAQSAYDKWQDYLSDSENLDKEKIARTYAVARLSTDNPESGWANYQIFSTLKELRLFVPKEDVLTFVLGILDLHP